MPDHLAGFTYRLLPGERRLTVVALHGTGGDENDLLQLGGAVAPGATLLSPRGRVLEQGMARFFRRHAEGVFDEDSIRGEAAALAQFLRSAMLQHRLEAQPRVALGYSNGANIAAALLLLHPGVLTGAVLLRPMLPLLPPTPPDLTHVPVLLSSGTRDPIVPAARVEALEDLLRRSGADVTLRWQSGAHGLMREDVADSQAWMEARFPQAGPPRT